MRRMTLVAASFGRGKGRQQEQQQDQNGTTSAQFSPRRNMAISVRTTIPAKTINVVQFTRRWSAGSQQPVRSEIRALLPGKSHNQVRIGKSRRPQNEIHPLQFLLHHRNKLPRILRRRLQNCVGGSWPVKTGPDFRVQRGTAGKGQEQKAKAWQDLQIPHSVVLVTARKQRSSLSDDRAAAG